MEELQWKEFSEGVSNEVVFNLIKLSVEKFNEGVNGWSLFLQEKDKFQQFVDRAIALLLNNEVDNTQLYVYVQFLKYLFRCIEIDEIREIISPLWNLQLWSHLYKRRLDLELSRNPRLKVNWEMMKTKSILQHACEQAEENNLHELAVEIESFLEEYDSNLRENVIQAIESAYAFIAQIRSTLEKNGQQLEEPEVDSRSRFFPLLFDRYFTLLQSPVNSATIACCVEMIDLLCDLLSQLSTRRFLSTFVRYSHFIARTRLSAFFNETVVQNHCSRLVYYLHFELDHSTNTILSHKDYAQFYYKKMIIFQRIVYKYFQHTLADLSMCSIQQLSSRNYLQKHLGLCDVSVLSQLAYQLRLLPAGEELPPPLLSKEFLMEVIICEYEGIVLPLSLLNETPLLPDEDRLWNGFSASSSLPRCNLQFLNLEDYLLRLHELYQIESFSQIQSDLISVIRACQVRLDFHNKIMFKGFSKMAVPIESFAITQVKKSTIREDRPSEVNGHVVFSIQGLKGDCRRGWECLREHDIVYFVNIRPQNKDHLDYSFGKEKAAGAGDGDEGTDVTFLEKEGILSIRCGEVVGMEDEEGKVLNNIYQPDDYLKRSGKKRKLYIRFDPLQYQQDMEKVQEGKLHNPYKEFNMLIRRDPASNNFKAVLETSLSLINSMTLQKALPVWLQDVLIGKGNPHHCNYRMLLEEDVYMNDFGDTFLDAEHVIESFSNYSITFVDKKGNELPKEQALPPYRLSFDEEEKTIQCISYMSSHSQPIVPSELRGENEVIHTNTIRFTPTQVEAIHSCLNEGVSLIVGPPGTGKTDVAVQVVSTLYHNNRDEHILLLTHSNHALNDIFEKMASRSIEKRHLLRLGQGERDLSIPDSYNRLGRVDYCLQRRLSLLECVKRLVVSMGYEEGHAYSCETAEHFYQSTIIPRMEMMKKVLEGKASEEEKERLASMPSAFTKDQESQWNEWKEKNDSPFAVYFPFKLFFLEQSQPLLPSSLPKQTVEEVIENCFASLRSIFAELKEYRPFELLRTNYQRVQYVLTNQARIIAMTCTHAAIARQRLLDANFQYDTLVIEEAGQIVELETFIPLVLQKASEEGCRLKRVVLLGDPSQLPPIVQNHRIAREANYDQSLFSRLIRLGVPSIQLDAQGRCRPSLASLFSWKYHTLTNLPCVERNMLANPCLRYEYQCIHCNGEEKEVQPHVYQNEVEANYIVAFYQYLRLCGYSSQQIAIITSYNGQRELIAKLMRESCKNNPVFGMPSKIATIDKYQGQQNDIILVSLVRTQSVGYMRDVRRMVVTVSRARLGLYMFCNTTLFSKCFELKPIFEQLLRRPCTLQLVESECIPCSRQVSDEVAGFEVSDEKHMMQIVYYYYEMKRKMMEEGSG